MTYFEQIGKDYLNMLNDMKSIEENKAWVKEFWETHDVITTPTFEFISWVREKQKAIDNKRTEELLRYLEELEAHYRDLGQYDDGKPIRRVIEYIESMEE